MLGDLDADLRAVADYPELGPAILPFVDGEPCGGSQYPALVIDPANGEPFARISYARAEDVNRAVDAAVRASSLWRGTSFAERGHRLGRLATLIRLQADSIAQLISREQGKPYIEALTQEVLPTLDHLRFITRHAGRYHAGLALEERHPYYAHKDAHYLYDPIGVVAVVTPSPLPFATPMIQVAAALAMGNAVIVKPSELTPLSGLSIGELCTTAGFPSGLVNVIPALPEDTLRLVAHPRVDKAFFTGRLDAGQQIMATAGCAPRPVVLSLGGKHAAVVAGDADEDRAVRAIAWGALANCGQNCGGVERVYVEECIATRFVERVLAEVDKIKVGNPLAEGVDMGPLSSDERRQEVHSQVSDAVAAGGRLIRGGVMPGGPGFFYPPTVVLDPPVDCRLMHEETLGPVIPIIVVENLERAILLANESDYALSASGWTRSSEKAERMMVGLQAGVVTINDLLYSFGEPASTWSGYKRSGLGQNHGTPGLREMCRQRFVSFDTRTAEAPVFAFPYDGAADSIARASLQYLHGRPFHKRLAALFRLLRLGRFRSRVPIRSMLFTGKHRSR